MACHPARTRRGHVRAVLAMVFAAAACVPAVLGGSLIEDIPDELVQEMKAAHPSMRQLMGAAERRLLQDNATNATGTHTHTRTQSHTHTG